MSAPLRRRRPTRATTCPEDHRWLCKPRCNIAHRNADCVTYVPVCNQDPTEYSESVSTSSGIDDFTRTLQMKFALYFFVYFADLGSRPMIQLLPRTRVQNLIASRLRGGKFKIPSPERDSGTGHARIEAIISAIEAALTSAESERDELNNRIEEVLARASVTVGNATDEYLDRELYRSHHQDLFDSEMARGEERTRELSAMIVHFRFVRAAMLSRFSCVSEINR